MNINLKFVSPRPFSQWRTKCFPAKGLLEALDTRQRERVGQTGAGVGVGRVCGLDSVRARMGTRGGI